VIYRAMNTTERWMARLIVATASACAVGVAVYVVIVENMNIF
jgi:hypothetical protein